ncbi:DUF58 domain-containing protein [Brevibacillus ginsengisoli]|uniref:DUF58 domain-containing protein n=1 Tax=Brevibacillus ginsengisoli TaxID=363854 RepID=UPI003CF2FFE4
MNTRQSLQLLGSTFLLFGFVSGSPFLWLFGGFFLFLVVLERLWLANIRKLVEISLQTDSTRVMPGTSVELLIRFTNKSWLPLPRTCIHFALPEHVEVTDADELTLANKRWTVKLWLSIPRRSQVTRTITIIPNKRGVLWMTEVQAEIVSPFAINVSPIDIPSTFTLLIYPEVVSVPPLTMGTTQPLGNRLAKQRLHTDPTFMRGVRPYSAGDRLKHIDWKTSAKTLSLHTKQFEYTAHAEWRIVGYILPSYEARIQQYNDEINERTISIIASLATSCRRSQTAYELLLSVKLRGQEFYRFPKGSGKSHHVQVMSHLARLHHFVPTHPLAIFHRLEQSTSKETILFVTPRLDDQLQAAMQRLVRLGHEVVVLDSSQETISYQDVAPFARKGVVGS